MQFHKTVGKLYQIKIFDNNNRIAKNTFPNALYDGGPLYTSREAW